MIHKLLVMHESSPDTLIMGYSYVVLFFVKEVARLPEITEKLLSFITYKFTDKIDFYRISRLYFIENLQFDTSIKK